MQTITEQLIQQLRTQGIQIFQYLVEHSTEATLMTNADLQVAYANHACNQLLSRTLLGQSLHAIWYPDDLPVLAHIIESAQVTSTFSTARVTGFMQVIDQFPGIEIVGRLAADWGRTKGQQAAEKFLRANPPGTLDVIWAASGEMALGALAAVEAAGRQGEVQIFSNDVTPESTALLQAGRLQAETHHGFADWGWYGAKFAVMLALGLPIPSHFDIRPRTVYRANAHRFYPEPVLEPIDWAAMKVGRSIPAQITIGWIQADQTGVYQTATQQFERAAAAARTHGLNVKILTHTLANPIDFAGTAAQINQYIAAQVDVIALSTVKVEAVRQAIRQATAAGIPVIVVNQLERIEGTDVACYIGFDNTTVGAISGYAVVDYLGGPGVLGRGPTVTVDADTILDWAWWQQLHQRWATTPNAVAGRVAIIEGISGSWQGEHRLVHDNGDFVAVDTVTFPVHSKTGQFLGLAAAFRDATLRKKTEAALKAYSEQLEELVAERTRDLQHAYRELQQENLERRRAELEKEEIIVMLKDALAHVKNLSGLLPICASCKKIRDDEGNWHQLELYIRDHSEADFSHSICPECRTMLYGAHINRAAKGNPS